MRRRPRLEAIDRDLAKAALLLESAAGKLRDANFGASRNILRIAEALARISDIQFEIYAAQPGLLPKQLVATKLGVRVLSNGPLERAGMNAPPRSKRARRPLNAFALDGLIGRAFDVLLKPLAEFNPTDTAGGKVQHETLLFVYRGLDVSAVEQEEGRHRSVGNALVPVNEWMPLSERKAQRSGFLDQRGVEIASAEGCPWLRSGRFKSAQVSNAGSAAGRCKHEAVQFHHRPG